MILFYFIYAVVAIFRLANGRCKCKEYFDGVEQGLVNVNNKRMVEYGLLVDYMTSFARNGTPLIAFYDALVDSNR